MARTVTENQVKAALAAYEAREFARARSLIDQVLATHPDDPGLLGIKGMAFFGEANFVAALDVLGRAAALSPNDSRLCNFLGQVHLANKDQILAERAFGQAVTFDANFIEAWYNLGLTQLDMHKLEEAVQSFLRVQQMHPYDAELSMHLARAYYLQRSIEAAAHELQNAMRYGIPAVRAQLWKCAILRGKGEIDAADELESALNRQYGKDEIYFATLVMIGQADSHVGSLTSAEHWLTQAIALRPDDVKPYVELAGVKKFKESDRAYVDQMVKLLERCPAEQKRGLDFALGKVFTDIGDFDRSFGHYKAGNDLVRMSVPFDIPVYINQVDSLIEVTSRSCLEKLPAGSDSDLPILIVGTPRSGTTLTEQIISSQKSVTGAGEMDIWPRLAPRLLENYSVEDARKVAQGCLDLMRQQAPHAMRVTDKMPGNFQHLGIIHAVFPNAKIIHVRRHPIDACLSIYFQNFNDGHAYKWDLASLAVWYEQYQRLMNHWRDVLPPDTFYEFRYEDLVEDTEGVSRKIMEFLGLEWEPVQLEFHKQDRAVFTASKWQARQPIYKTSTERWRRYEKHLGPLLPLLKYA
jgi:tetratricopeptide (TPR) repeat protein